MAPLASNGQLVLDSLPTEIQDLIFHYVVLDATLDELKALRQSNRYFRDRADIYLFQRLHVSASTASLERVKRISENDRLNVHVRELVFHRGTFFGHKMARAAHRFEVRARNFDDFQTYLVQSSGQRGRADILQDSKCYSNFNEELGYESRFNQDMTWRSTLRKPCSLFPKLEGLRTLPVDEDLESAYLRKRCGLTHQSWTPNYFAPYEIFEVCGPKFRPKALRLDSVNGEDFASIISNIRGGEAAVAARFADLRDFHISFSETVTTLEVEGTWDIFIRSCTSLQSLFLDFESFYSPKLLKEPDSFPQKFIKTVLCQHFPRLKGLGLSFAMMYEDDILGFLERHQRTLMSFRLYTWPMPVDATGLPSGSIIRAFWKVGQLPMSQLRLVELRGEFSNRVDGDGWAALPYGELILSRLEAYVRQGGSNKHTFPFPIDKATMDEAKSGKQLQELDELPNGLKCDDPTFRLWEIPARALADIE